ncbi:50S ribosomal protein L1 [Rhynchospora pubera]|uniref:Large ribosomal subunit protein uL1c n=1 Tax=Rhynchospora pubera TaxID=906938 RepID=A0AAV8FDV6_9POAL|nr:50S ribosomal protein L1 [Rhynchospora pubera]
MAHLRLLRHHSHHCDHNFALLRLIAPFCSSSAPIKPVAYPVKPKEPTEEEKTTQHQAPTQEQPTSSSGRLGTMETLDLLESLKSSPSPTWTREEARFMKDAPVITPVSYAAKVAPLPEDRVEERQEEIEEKERQEAQEQLNREARRMEPDFRMRRHIFGIQEEEKIPYPTLIRVEKKPQKVAVDLMEAIRQVKANAKRNFVETVEAHVNLGVDPRRGDQMVRGALTLPHGTGKTVRVAVFAEGAAAEEARTAGADVVGGDELIEQIRTGGGKLNFDKCIATPMYMPRLSKIARILGPRGLMPNPKLGSVTSDVSNAVKAAKCGRIDFKIDKTAIVHVGLGKVNFSEEVLRENIGAFVNALLLAKPAGLKKTSKYAGYVKNFTLSCTMGPGFPVTVQSLSAAADHYSKLQVK